MNVPRPMRPLIMLLACLGAIVPSASAGTFFGPYQTGFVAGDGWTQVLWYDYATGASEAQPTVPAPYIFGYPVPSHSWIGLFLYDYNAARFTWGMYTYKEPLPVVL